MISTPQEAWTAGRDAGHADGKAKLAQAGSWAVEHATFCTVQEMPADRQLWPAWLNGYGHGISEAAWYVPGHHLARGELVPDR